MKKITCLLMSMLMLFGITIAGDIVVQEQQQILSTCNPSQSTDRIYYLGNGGVGVIPYDLFAHGIDSLIGKSDNGSSVQIWRGSGSSVISGCLDWNRISTVVVANDTNGAMIFQNSGGCYFNTPSYRKISNPTGIDAQIHYTVGYREINSSGPNSITTRLAHKDHGANNWTCYPGGNIESSYSSCNPTTVHYGSQLYHTGECINYRLFRCGDGLLNSPYGTTYNNGTFIEACDPNDPNHTGWGNGGCSASCQPITQQNPQCNSTYNGQTRYTYLNSNPWLSQFMIPPLCTVGTVTNFTGTGAPRHFTWNCTTGGNTVACSADQQWCGDGQVNGSEACDPNDSTHTGWGNGGCSASCQPIIQQNPQCNSTYNGHTQYTSSSAPWLNSGMNLCTIGTVTNFQYGGTPRHFTWSCTTGGNTVACSANQQWCGDGQVNGSEACDPNDSTHTGWGNGGCSASCQPITQQNPQCNSTYNGHTQYTSSSAPWLNSGMNLCTIGTVTNFQYTGTPRHFTWSCTTGGNTVACSANQQWCGDGQVNGSEACDPNDSTHTGWGNGGCSASCQPITQQNPQCNSTYNGHTQYTSSSAPWLNSGMNLCTIGTVTNFTGTGAPRHFTWSCTTGGNTVACSANQQWCGDGQIQTSHGEACDEGALNGTPGHCSLTCDGVVPPPQNPQCNSTYNGHTQYTSSSAPWLNSGMNLCTIGTVTNFQYGGTPRHFTWNCTTGGNTVACSANQQWCGDGQVNGSEACDPNDSTHTGWGSGGCSASCQPITLTGPACSSMYNGQTVANLVSGDYLCDVGTISDFVYDSSTRRWTWKCNNAVGTVSCYAYKSTPAPQGQLEIKKTLVGSGEISNTGDIVSWKIRVTATGGNVTNFTIRDIMPNILRYSNSHVLHSGGLVVQNPPTLSGNTEVIWHVTGTLNQGDYVEIQLDTYAIVMPDHDYDNVACVKYNEETGEREICDDEPIPSPKLWLKKYFTDGTKHKNVRIRDEIAYKIIFGNSGNASATITSIKDFLPKNVEYVTGSIFIAGTSAHTSLASGSEVVTNTGYTVQGVYVDIYTGITLRPGQTGHIILTGRVLSGFTDQRTNFACIYLNDVKIECDHVVHDLTGVSCVAPNITTNSFTNAGGSTTVVCNTSSSSGENADLIELDCENGTIFTGANIPQLTGTCSYPSNNSSSTATYTVQCKVNGRSENYCRGTVSVAGKGGGCFPQGTKVTMADGTKKNIEEVKEGDIVLSYNTITDKTESNVVIQRIVHEDNIHEMYELTINGNVLKVTDVHPFYVRKSAFSMDYAWIKAQDLKVGDILLMNDGNLVKIDKINHYNNQETVYNLEVEGNHDYFVDKGYLVHNKGGVSCERPTIRGSGKIREVICGTDDGSRGNIEIDCGYNNQIYTGTNVRELTGTCDYRLARNGTYTVQCSVNNRTNSTCKKEIEFTGGTTPDNPIYYTPQCFNVNTNNISIEKGEVLPFFWNIRNVRNIDAWTVIAGEFKDSVDDITRDIIRTNVNNSCDDNKAIALNSMICSFKITNGNHETVYSGAFPCLRDTGSRGVDWVSDIPLLKAWMEYWKRYYTSNSDNFFWSFSNADSLYILRSNLNYIENFGNNQTVLGEYKLSLTDIKYLQCQDNEWRLVHPDIASCENNFMLTNPYTVQKTPSGNLRASTESLGKYFVNMDGSSTFSRASQYLQAIAITDDNYAPNQAVNDAMTKFISKYQKLAVSVSTSKFGRARNLIIKKVPGKSIYFVEGNIEIGGNENSIDKPFTIIQTSGNTTIKGSISHNMMLLTNGKIIFEDTNTCAPTSNQTRQVVKGIFYAKDGIERLGVLKNNDTGRYRRCTEGGLTIKGVLIGNGLKDMMKGSRSNLNNWFYATTDTAKKNLVMNGASVLIEYSPSIFTVATMPPGAEDFTSALSIYKQ